MQVYLSNFTALVAAINSKIECHFTMTYQTVINPSVYNIDVIWINTQITTNCGIENNSNAWSVTYWKTSANWYKHVLHMMFKHCACTIHGLDLFSLTTTNNWTYYYFARLINYSIDAIYCIIYMDIHWKQKLTIFYLWYIHLAHKVIKRFDVFWSPSKKYSLSLTATIGLAYEGFVFLRPHIVLKVSWTKPEKNLNIFVQNVEEELLQQSSVFNCNSSLQSLISY